VLANYEPIYVQ